MKNRLGNFDTPGHEAAEVAMRDWFNRNFEDPANGVPWEGGYHYVNGGPHSPYDVLLDRFQGQYDEAHIQHVGDKISGEGGLEWVRRGSY